MGIKRIYIFDEVNLQTIIDLSGGFPKAIFDWDEDISKLSLLISTTSSRVIEKASKPVFKYTDEMALIVGKYSIVATIENVGREEVKEILSKIYKKLMKENPVTSNEIADLVIKIFET